MGVHGEFSMSISAEMVGNAGEKLIQFKQTRKGGPAMQAWGLTDPGCVRVQNQDAYGVHTFEEDSLLWHRL